MIILRANRRCRTTLRLGALVWLALAIVVGTAGAADAHAGLVSTNPAPGSVIAQSPRTIELHFSEPVELPTRAVRLFDANRNSIALGTISHGASNDTVVAVVPLLSNGGYVAAWRVISADGHPVSAAFTFAVGEGAVGSDVANAIAQLSPSGASRANGVLSGMARAIAYAAIAVLIGGLLLVATTWRDAFEHRRTARVLIGAAVVSVIATVFVYGLQGVNARAGRLADLLSPSTWREMADSHVGRWLLARLVVLVVALVAVVSLGQGARALRRSTSGILVVFSAAVIVCVAEAGHASSGRYTMVGVGLDIVHVTAMSVWIGGLVLVRFAVLAPSPIDAVRRVTTRFSQLALLSVVAIVITGSALAWRQGVALRDLTASDYGTVLVVKVAVVAVLIAAGGLSRRIVRGRWSIVPQPAWCAQ